MCVFDNVMFVSKQISPRNFQLNHKVFDIQESFKI